MANLDWTDPILSPQVTRIKAVHIQEIRDYLNLHIGNGGAEHPVATSVSDGFLSALDKQRLDSLVAGSGGLVTAVTATLPIVSSGGAAPVISINPATPSTPGSMSAADKAKLDNLGSLTPVAPIVISNGNISINAATTSNAGSMSAADKVKLDGMTAVPIGSIIMWWGNISAYIDGTGRGLSGNILKDWALCNGQNGTPNLVDRFPLGAGNKQYGSTGGEVEHTLVTEEMPTHRHVDPYSEGASGINGFPVVPGSYGSGGSAATDSDQPLLYTGYEGGSGYSDSFHRTEPTTLCVPHNNMPPYVAVWYIMRLT